MDIKEKVYSMFILGTDGDGYKEALKYGLGGMIFFSKDIQSKEQFTDLISAIKSKSSAPMFFSIDQEGGRVERTENLHNGKKYLSAKYAYEKGLDFLQSQTAEIAEELKDFGINLNFAPCIDVNTNPDNPIIGERAFSNSDDEVIEAEKIVSETYRANGVCPCVKHFPGHGDADADSHLSLPKIDLSLLQMEKTHLKPFKSAITDGIEMVMVAHLHCTCFEKEEIPTSLSKNALNYLHKELGFKGIAISDDMIMKGVAKFGAIEACEMGIKAGLNMFIYRNSDAETMGVINAIAEKTKTDLELRSCVENSYLKIMDVLENLAIRSGFSTLPRKND